MLTFDTDITIYTLRKKGRDDLWTRTVLHRASWHGKQAARPGESGLVTASQYTVRVLAENMEGYVTPDEWAAMSSDTVGSWTVQPGDVVVRGVVRDEITGIAQITNKYKACFTVTDAFDNRRVGLKHLKIEGK